VSEVDEILLVLQELPGAVPIQTARVETGMDRVVGVVLGTVSHIERSAVNGRGELLTARKGLQPVFVVLSAGTIQK